MPLSDILCDPALCGRVEVEIKEVTLANSEYHGDIFCHLIPESWVIDGIRDKINGDLDAMRRNWSCDDDCACTGVKIADFEVLHTRHLHREHLWDSNAYHGNCRLTADLSTKLQVKIYAGVCHTTDAVAIAACSAEIEEVINRLRELGAGFRELLDPDELWKRIGGVSPKALRESPSVEPPRRIRLRRRETSSEERQSLRIPVEKIRGVGAGYATKLTRADIHFVDELVAFQPRKVATVLGTTLTRAKTILAAAKAGELDA